MPTRQPKGGGIVVDLAPVDGTTGMSMTNVSLFNNGDSLTYETLVGYDGYINVHASPNDLNTLVAQGDIGGNALSGDSITYAPEYNSNVGG